MAAQDRFTEIETIFMKFEIEYLKKKKRKMEVARRENVSATSEK